jgi:hypothetical protein
LEQGVVNAARCVAAGGADSMASGWPRDRSGAAAEAVAVAAADVIGLEGQPQTSTGRTGRRVGLGGRS